ncbi:glycoside hydrolase family 18 protein [Pleomassaria siparia CBS 279.74]|uniref:chitinase n=1 Tax=Pleomassaria siparia CBS 279.74 TaxID=1314801 RepID=A0A6G1KPP0_9PLEO|nr:glycoside hydrolase family 18 protein [Pleomassaria siparia CBS 279.74]
MQFLHVLLFAGAAQAQYNQRWKFNNVQNSNGAWVPRAQWRPDNDFGTPWGDVVFPIGVIQLEYNCHKMPAICQNAQNWHSNAALSAWHTQGEYAGWFSYDLGASESQLDRGNARREQNCPHTWKGTILQPRCPETNQPRVVPPLYDMNGIGVTALAPQTGPNLIEIIADGKDSPIPSVGQLQPSGRMYTCDEFPPASWIEGGVGIPGQGGLPGTTYCAPMAWKCDNDHDARGSEQNWQGQIHGLLGAHLEARVAADGMNYDRNTPIAFRFEYESRPNERWAARVLTDRNDGNYDQAIIPGTPFRRNEENYLRPDISFIPNANGSLAIELSNGEVFRTHERRAMHYAIERVRNLSRRGNNKAAINARTEEGVSRLNNETKTPEWHITAEDVNPALSVYGLQTQQDPVDAIDIIEWSKQIILGQVESNNNTKNATLANQTTAHISRQHPRAQHADMPVSPNYIGLQKRVDGPIQCGPDQPCLDGSCCSLEGKCGYKQDHCGTGNCLSNCKAKAMCGVDSADGKTPCGLKLCCSYYGWCGTEDVHCKDPEPLVGKTPCQQGYGSCQIKPSPSCGTGSGTSKGRRIGYYQGWNTRERLCDKVSPRQINTRGLNHLLYAFAFFHPQTFEMMPMNSDDLHLYGEFTALKRNGLQTWIAIGGSFNDPGTETYNSYSNMVSTETNRRAFIQSLIKFMDTYGFQGADIDWEYPAEPKRGGGKEDTDNLVLLMKEMKEQLGGRFGSSLTLAPDYWYLRGFKPAAMQDYVDWMGFMSYDLHGPWDTDVKTLGSKVRPQTDITEIEKNMKPLCRWYASCDKMGCSFVPDIGGTAGSCTNFPGILSNLEIKRMIKDEGIAPYLNKTAMVKYFTYQGKSWVGYDDAETYAMKEGIADSYCLGGIMIWSVDFDDETGVGLGDANDYRSPESATVIPMAHTTVPHGQTFTLNPGAATDIPHLPNGGDQNSPQGPGADKCEQCSFFRLITSTCCGSGGSVGNPILIPAGVPTPMDIPLPAGFNPPQSFIDPGGNIFPANQPLPREVIIPQGTVFPQPFVIGPGTSLRQGEGDDQSSNSSNLVWLSPEIWNDPNPSVQCFFPCTFVLPPYTSFTTTIDYPRITVTESGTIKTTLTFPPLTVSSWAPTTIIVGGRKVCTATATGTSSCTEMEDNHRTSTVAISRSITWPEVTYTSSSTRRTTRPPPPTKSGNPDDKGCPFPFICPPLPPKINLPPITINFGPPKPTTTPCAWQTLTCNPKPGPPGTGPNPTSNPHLLPPPSEGNEEDEEDEEDEHEFCTLQSRSKTTVGITVTATTIKTVIVKPTPTPTTTQPPPAKTPDFDKDEIKCYDSGQWTRRARMINAADTICDGYLKGKTLTKNWNPGEISLPFSRVDAEAVPVKIVGFVEVTGSGCEWKVDANQCKTVFRKIIDECDKNGENRKQGGRVVGDCITWRLDPNADL